MKKNVVAILILLIGFTVFWIALFSKPIDVSISEHQVQAIIEQEIENGSINSRGVELAINSAIIDFKANGLAEIRVDFIADGYGHSGTVAGDFVFDIRYDEPKFFLDDIALREIELVADTETAQAIQDIQNVAGDFLTRQRNKMLSEEAKESLDNIIARNSKSLSNAATELAYKFFETIPIYDLDSAGIKGSLARLALKDVQFTEDSAIVTLSPSQALIKILTFIVFVILVLWGAMGFPVHRHQTD